MIIHVNVLFGMGTIIFSIRGHSTTTWTEFCHFLTHPRVDSFYNLSVDKNRHF